MVLLALLGERRSWYNLVLPQTAYTPFIQDTVVVTDISDHMWMLGNARLSDRVGGDTSIPS